MKENLKKFFITKKGPLGEPSGPTDWRMSCGRDWPPKLMVAGRLAKKCMNTDLNGRSFYEKGFFLVRLITASFYHFCPHIMMGFFLKSPRLVPRRRFELLTSALPKLRSTCWATATSDCNIIIKKLLSGESLILKFLFK